MSENTVTLTLKVDDKGTLSLVTKEAKKASKAVEGVARSKDKTTKSANRYNKAEKGVAGATSNTTKAFSKQAQTMGGSSGIVAAYATLAANVFAVSAGFGALKRAAAFEQLEQGLIKVGAAAGMHLKSVAAELVKITDAAISTKEAMSAVALGTSAGFSVTQMEGLTKVAKGASLALGRDMADAMSRLTRGAAKLEPEILDELGIMVRLDTATKDYAESVGKTSAQLTQFERRMAFTNAIIDQGAKKFGTIGASINANPYDKLSAAFEDLTQTVFSFLNLGLKPLASILASNPTALLGVLILFGATITKNLIPSLTKMGAVAATSASRAAAGVSKAFAKEAAAISGAQNKELSKNAKNLGSFSGVPKSIKAQEAAFKSTTASVGQYDASIKKLNASIRSSETAIKKGKVAGRTLDETALKNLKAKVALNKTLVTQLSSQRNLKSQINSTETASLSGSKSKRNSVGSRISSRGLNRIAEAGVIDSFKIATRHSVLLGKSALKTTGSLNILKVGFKAAGMSAKLFGAALLGAIPIVGQIISIALILWDVLSSVIPDDFFGKTDNAITAFDNFSDISAELAVNMGVATTAVERHSISLASTVGIAGQLTKELRSLTQVKIDEFALQIRNLSTELEELERMASTGEGNKWWHIFFPDEVMTQYGEAAVNGVRKAIEKIKEEQTEVGASAEEVTKVINAALRNIDSNPALRASLVLQRYRAEVEKVQKQMDAGELIPAKAEEQIRNLGVQLAAGQNAIREAAASASKFTTEINRMGDKQKGPFDTLISSLNELDAMWATASTKLIGGAAAFKQALGDFKINPKDFASVAAQLVRVQKAMLTSKATAKAFKEEARALKDTMKLNPVVVVEYYTALNNGIFAQIEAKNLELGVTERLKYTEAQILNIENEIIALYDQVTSKKEILLRASIETTKVELQSLTNQKQLLDLINKISSSKKSMLDSDIELAKQAKEMAILQDPTRKDKSLTAADEVAILDSFREKKLDSIKEETALKLMTIDMEFDLLRARFILLQKEQELAGIKDTTGFAAQYENMLFNAQVSATEAALKASEVAANNVGLEIARGYKKGMKEALASASSGKSTQENLVKFSEAGGFKGLETQDAEGNVDPNISEKILAMDAIVSPIKESLRELGPNGELVSAVAEGALMMASSFTGAFEVMSDTGSSLGERMAAGLQAGASAIGSIGSMMQANSKAQISEIDNQIDAEKKRDGKSKESLAKLAQLEKKKEKMQKKAFEQDKKMKMAQVVMATAAGVMQAFAQTGIFGFVTGALIAAMGVAQLAVIAGSSFQGGGAGAAAGGGGPSKVSMGDRSNSVDLAKGVNPAGEQAFMRGERGIGSGMTNFTPAFVGVKHRASGGATAGYMVGEQGPELFTPDRPGTIAPADESASRGSNMAVSFQINAIDSASVEDMLMSKRGVIIKNIRDAANQHGEFFLEQIREDSLT